MCLINSGRIWKVAGVKIRTLVYLFVSFSKIGLLSIGGGYVMLPMMRSELVRRRGWVSDDELVNYFAASQTVPGVIAANTAAFVGNRVAGLPGALTAVTGMIFPSLLSILVVAFFFTKIQHNETVQRAFRGIRVAVAALLIVTVKDLAFKTIRSPYIAVAAAVSFILIAVISFSPMPVIIVSGLLALAAAGLGWFRK